MYKTTFHVDVRYINRKLGKPAETEKTPSVSLNFSFSHAISTRVDITVNQTGKCFIFLLSSLPSFQAHSFVPALLLLF